MAALTLIGSQDSKAVRMREAEVIRSSVTLQSLCDYFHDHHGSWLAVDTHTDDWPKQTVCRSEALPFTIHIVTR